MSRAGVGMVVEKLLTDQNLRVRFALDRMETVAELLLQGFDLTHDEIDLFLPDRSSDVVSG
jgi:3-oxoacyl-[acyl-carrier-protein] synthase III